jgi:hypothetical protein
LTFSVATGSTSLPGEMCDPVNFIPPCWAIFIMNL